MAYRYLKKFIPLRALAIDLDDIRKIFERLLPHLEEEAERQTQALVRPPEQSEEEFSRQVAIARRNAFRITITIGGGDGQDLFGDTVELFSSPNCPDSISYVYMTNNTAYQGQTGNKPANRFELHFDFANRPLLDNSVSAPPPNSSSLTIEGDRDAWVASIQEAVMGVLDKRKTQRKFINQAYVYDFGLLLFGLPFGFYLCARIAPSLTSIPVLANSAFLTSAVYVYILFVGLWCYRLLFGYTRWAFPTMELKDNENKSKRHRGFWYAILIGILGTVIYDAIHAIS